MENPSLRVNGKGGSTNRTFIVDDFAEDEFGRWAIDEVTGEQGYIDDEKVVLLDIGRQRVYLAVQTVKKSPSEGKRKGKAKGKEKGGFKGTGRVFFGEEQAQDPELWSGEDFSWWSKEKTRQKRFFER